MNSSGRIIGEDAPNAYIFCPESVNFRRQLKLLPASDSESATQPISPVSRVKLQTWEEVRLEIIEVEIRNWHRDHEKSQLRATDLPLL